MTDKHTNIDDLINKATEPQADYQKFKGILLFSPSFYGSVALLVGSVGCIYIYTIHSQIYIIAGSILLIWLAISSFNSDMNYFIINGDCLIVKNHIIFWKNIKYKLTDISKVLLHVPKLSYSRSIEITLKGNNEIKNYSAGSLFENQWKQLRELLVAKNVPAYVDNPINISNV